MRDESFHTCLLSPLIRGGICIPTPLTFSPESERMWPLTGRKQPEPLGQLVSGRLELVLLIGTVSDPEAVTQEASGFATVGFSRVKSVRLSHS